MKSVYYFLKKVLLKLLLTCATAVINAAQLNELPDLPDLRGMLENNPSLLAVNGTPLSLSYTDNFEAPPSESIDSSWLCALEEEASFCATALCEQTTEDEGDQGERKRPCDSTVSSHAKRAKLEDVTLPTRKEETRQQRAARLSRLASSIVYPIGPAIRINNNPTQLELLFAARRRCFHEKRGAENPCVARCENILDAWDHYKTIFVEKGYRKVGACRKLWTFFFTAVERSLVEGGSCSQEELYRIVTNLAETITVSPLRNRNTINKSSASDSGTSREAQRARNRKYRNRRRCASDQGWGALGAPLSRYYQRPFGRDLGVVSPDTNECSEYRMGTANLFGPKGSKQSRDAAYSRRFRLLNLLISPKFLEDANPQDENERERLARLQALAQKIKVSYSEPVYEVERKRKAGEELNLLFHVWDRFKEQALQQGSIRTLQASSLSSPVLREFFLQAGRLLVEQKGLCRDSLEQIAKDILEKAKTGH